mgnify:CR=1 FL=1
MCSGCQLNNNYICVLWVLFLDGTNTDEYTIDEETLVESVVAKLNSIVENMMLDSNSDSDWEI